MAKKKGSSRGVWIVIIFIVFGILDDMPNMGGTTIMIVLFWIIVIGLAWKKIVASFTSSSSDSGSKGGFGILATLAEEMKKAAAAQQSIQQQSPQQQSKQQYKQNQAQERQEQAEQRDQDMQDSLIGHTSSDTPTGATLHNYSYEELTSNYHKGISISKDDLGKNSSNPFSLDGK